MTQLYVGNLSAEGDEKAIRALFGKYGQVREVLMKNGYAFVEFENPVAAEDAMRELNGTDILGHPMIVEPSHQQRLSSRYMRKGQCGRVEVTDIPPRLNIQGLEALLSHVGSVLKLEVDEGDYGVIKRVIATYESQDQAQTAVSVFAEASEHTPKVSFYENGMRNVTTRKGSPSMPSSPSKNSDFPLRVLVPSDMVGAIIGKDGATIRMITQLTRARVDVHRRENLGTAEKAITIIGPPECCTEACYQIMKIMQNELLMTSGMLDAGKFHEPLPVVPLKVLAHNELVGRVIGKGGNTLKRIMAESGTKITISKLKDLTAYNMERTITILGTIDNCKKAESLISAKLRASYESDMAQFIPEQNHVYNHQTLSPSPTNVPTAGVPGMPPSSSTTMNSELIRLPQAQSLPATPTATNVRTFLDYSGEHTRLTTLHGSTGALEVNNLGGFKLGPIAQTVANNGGGGGGGPGTTAGPVGGKLASAFESTIVDGMVKFNGSSAGGGGGAGNGSIPTTSATNLQMNGHPSSSATINGGGLSGLVMNGNSSLSSSANGHIPAASSSSSGGGLNSLGLGNGQDSAHHISLSHSFSGVPGMKLSTTSAAVTASQSINPTGSVFTGNILNPPQSAGPLGPSHHNNRVPRGGGGGGQGSGLGDLDDEISDVFHGLSFRDPLTAAPGYGRSRLRRSSAPVASLPNAPGSNRAAAIQNGYGLWGGFAGSDNHLPVLPDSDDSDEFPLPGGHQSQKLPPPQQQQVPSSSSISTTFSGGNTWGTSVQSPAVTSQNIWGGVVSTSTSSNAALPPPSTVPFQPGMTAAGLPGGQTSTAAVMAVGQGQQQQHIVGQHQQLQQQQGGQGSRPNSQTSSYSGSNSDQSGFSPIYSPTGASGFGGFSPINNGLEMPCGLLTTAGTMFPLGEERESRSPFKASVPTPLTTVAESAFSSSWAKAGVADEDEQFLTVTSATLEILGDGSQPTMIPPISTGTQW